MSNYNVLLKHPKWFEKRRSVLMRDENKCKLCGSMKNLQIHHRQYHVNKKTEERKVPWDYKLKHLLTLCSNCHQKGHSTYSIPIFKI